MRLPQGQTTECLEVDAFCRSALLDRVREQWHGVSGTPAQGVCRPQGCSYPGEIEGKLRVLTEACGPLEEGECPGQVTLTEGQQTDPPRGNHEARGVIDGLGQLEPFVPEGM